MRATGQHAENHAEKEDRRAPDLPAIEREVAARWAEIDVAAKTLARTQAQDSGRPVWSCYAQPSPTAGVPDLAYARARTISDLYSRFKTMQGMVVPEATAGTATASASRLP